MIGPRKKTSDERMQIAHSIAQQVIAKYGGNVRAIGIYGSLARKSDGPFSDIELKCVCHQLEHSYSYEWTAGDWKAEVNFDQAEVIIEEAITVEEDWPLTNGKFFDLQPLYDPSGFFLELKDKAATVENARFKEAICKTIVEEMYEYMGKLRNIAVQGPTTFLPILAMKIAMTGAMIVGLHHRQCYTTSAQVLPEALAMDDQPHGLKALAEMVMTGNLTNPQQIIAACENFWQTLLQWTAEKGYQIKCSKEIPW
jgi:kanamycin nucleotidyltransferase